MSRPFKQNEMPVAPFNLRETGPLSFNSVLHHTGGAKFRAASGSDPDKRATLDKDPCPHCGALVEWAHTAKGGVQFLYARCKGGSHRWGFRARATVRPTPPVAVDIVPLPRPGSVQMSAWVDKKLQAIEQELEKLKQFQQLGAELAAGVAFSPPNNH